MVKPIHRIIAFAVLWLVFAIAFYLLARVYYKHNQYETPDMADLFIMLMPFLNIVGTFAIAVVLLVNASHGRIARFFGRDD